MSPNLLSVPSENTQRASRGQNIPPHSPSHVPFHVPSSPLFTGYPHVPSLRRDLFHVPSLWLIFPFYFPAFLISSSPLIKHTHTHTHTWTHKAPLLLCMFVRDFIQTFRKLGGLLKIPITIFEKLYFCFTLQRCF